MIVLTLVTDRRRLRGRDLASLLREASAAGVDQIQIREKDLGGRELLAMVCEAVHVVAGTPTRVLVNGRADVALAAGAHGVQLPEEGLAVAEVKRAFPRLLLGASRHDAEGVRRAEAEGADFVLLGPIFPTPGKPQRALGLAALEEAARGVRVPVHAIGGIEPCNARQAAAAGARGLAAIRPFLAGPVAAVIEAFRRSCP